MFRATKRNSSRSSLNERSKDIINRTKYPARKQEFKSAKNTTPRNVGLAIRPEPRPEDVEMSILPFFPSTPTPKPEKTFVETTSVLGKIRKGFAGRKSDQDRKRLNDKDYEYALRISHPEPKPKQPTYATPVNHTPFVPQPMDFDFTPPAVHASSRATAAPKPKRHGKDRDPSDGDFTVEQRRHMREEAASLREIARAEAIANQGMPSTSAAAGAQREDIKMGTTLTTHLNEHNVIGVGGSALRGLKAAGKSYKDLDATPLRDYYNEEIVPAKAAIKQKSGEFLNEVSNRYDAHASEVDRHFPHLRYKERLATVKPYIPKVALGVGAGLGLYGLYRVGRHYLGKKKASRPKPKPKPKKPIEKKSFISRLFNK